MEAKSGRKNKKEHQNYEAEKKKLQQEIDDLKRELEAETEDLIYDDSDPPDPFDNPELRKQELSMATDLYNGLKRSFTRFDNGSSSQFVDSELTAVMKFRVESISNGKNDGFNTSIMLTLMPHEKIVSILINTRVKLKDEERTYRLINEFNCMAVQGKFIYANGELSYHCNYQYFVCNNSRDSRFLDTISMFDERLAACMDEVARLRAELKKRL